MQTFPNHTLKHFSHTLLVLLLVCPWATTAAQLEQQLSVNISGGYFNTAGWTGWEPEGWYTGAPYEPTLMPNFTSGVSVAAGIQYNFSRHFSVEFRLGFQYSSGWYYDYSEDGQEEFNYLYYEIYEDEISYVVAIRGENYMDLGNYHLGIAPRYYFLPGRRVNPFLLAGININNTDVYFDNREYQAYVDLGREDEYTGSEGLTNWFDYQVGIGVLAGIGAEMALSDFLGIFIQADYHFVPMREGSIYYPEDYAHFHGINLHLGVRISFLRSKEL
jgi:hypothetical protein